MPKAATIEALPDLLAKYTDRASDKVRSVNLARAHVRAFLRDTVGVSHALYRRVQDMRPLKRKPRERGTRHPLPVILNVVEKLNTLCPGAGDMAWTLAATGMGNKEYWHDGFAPLADRVSIYGQKRDNRTREVPRWSDAPLVKPVCWEGRFRDLLREASGGAVSIYDLRRSFARWCEEAGIIESNRDAYLGHGPKTMTQLYTFGQLPGQLQHDAALLRAYGERMVGVRAEA
jgi:integrase